jgi:hypothetical protein
MRPKDFNEIIKKIKNNEVKQLILNENGLTEDQVLTLAKELTCNISLISLHLDSNNIGPKVAEALAKSLEDNKTLMELSLEDNNLGVEGGATFTEYLKSNSSLVRIWLRDNNIGYKNREAFRQIFKDSNNLLQMDVSDKDAEDTFGFWVLSHKKLNKLEKTEKSLNKIIDYIDGKIARDKITSDDILRVYENNAHIKALMEEGFIASTLPILDDLLFNFKQPKLKAEHQDLFNREFKKLCKEFYLEAKGIKFPLVQDNPNLPCPIKTMPREIIDMIIEHNESDFEQALSMMGDQGLTCNIL